MAQKNNILRIALIGPESTAKSTLAETLAAHYGTLWVKEYSREYLDGLNRKYTLEDIELIARHQLQQENELLKKADKILFADTELIISKVWCEDVFETCPEWIIKNLSAFKYDFYLLTYPDLEWLPDPVRENPHRRDFFYKWYERELKNISADYAVIRGTGNERLSNAINAVENFIAGTKK